MRDGSRSMVVRLPAGLPGAVLAAVLALVLAGCGTTVSTAPAASTPGGATPADNGLGAPAAATDGAGPVASGAPGPVAASAGGPSTGVAAGAPTGAPDGATAPGPVTKGTGPASTRGPIKIGIIYVNNDQGASSAGVSNGNTFTPRRAYEALVSAYNARGGVAGRRINPVYVELKSSSTSLKADIDVKINQTALEKKQ